MSHGAVAAGITRSLLTQAAHQMNNLDESPFMLSLSGLKEATATELEV